jgi:hypothetical protein
MNKKIKYTSKNGYTGVMYGKSSLVILDENGKEVFHTGSRTCNTYEELVEQTDTYPEFRAMLENFFKKEVKK